MNRQQSGGKESQSINQFWPSVNIKDIYESRDVLFEFQLKFWNTAVLVLGYTKFEFNNKIFNSEIVSASEIWKTKDIQTNKW